MIWTRTCDPLRNLPQWAGLIRPGEYAVFFCDAATHVARDADGRPFESEECASLALCDDLPAAVAFATEVVACHPSLCGEIYDHEGKSKNPLREISNPAVRGRYGTLLYAQRQTFWGSLALLCGLAFIVHDIMRDLAWIWGYVIGVKLTLVGGFQTTQGILGWYEHRGGDSQVPMAARDSARAANEGIHCSP